MNKINQEESKESKQTEQQLLHIIDDNNQLSWRRWPIIIFFYLAVLINGIPFEICAPIATSLSNIYSVSDSIVTLSSTSYLLMHPLLSFQCAHLIVVKGWALSANIGVLFTILGCGIKIFINQYGYILKQFSFYFVIIGQVLCGVGRPFILNAQASMAIDQFRPKSRILIITLLNVVHTLSFVLSVLIPGLLIFHNYKYINQVESEEKGKQLTQQLMYFEFYLSLGLLPCFIFFKTQHHHKHKIDHQVMHSIREMCKNLNFILILIPFSIYFGMLKAILVIMNYILEPFQFDHKVVTIAGSIPIVFGMLSQACLPYLINKWNCQKKGVLVLMFVFMTSCGCLYFTCSTHNEYVVYIGAIMIAIAITPAIPLMMDFSCDIVYPINASFGVGAMYIGSTLLAVCFGQGFEMMIGGKNSTELRVAITCAVIALFCLVGLIMFCFADVTKKKKSLSFSEVAKLSEKENVSGLFNCSLNMVADIPTINFDEDEDDEVDEEQK